MCNIGEGNGSPLQCSCLVNPRDGGAWWAATYGVTWSQMWLKRLSSSSSSRCVMMFQYTLEESFPFRDIFWNIYGWKKCHLRDGASFKKSFLSQIIWINNSVNSGSNFFTTNECSSKSPFHSQSLKQHRKNPSTSKSKVSGRNPQGKQGLNLVFFFLSEAWAFLI